MDKRFLTQLLPVVVCLTGIAGCATKYVPDDSVAQAKLRYIADVPYLTSLWRLDIESCGSKPDLQQVAVTNQGPIFGGANEISQVDMIGSSAGEETTIRERKIHSNEPFIFSAWVSESSSIGIRGFTCLAYGRFEPVDGMQYELTFDTDRKSCRINVQVLTESPSGAIQRSPELTFVPYRVPKTFDRTPNAKGMCQVAFPESAAKLN